MRVFDVEQGSSPVILAFPHTGTDVPDDICEKLNDNGKILADTDWHIHRLYDGLLPGVTTVRALFHRYVIDANRDPSGQSLYPGQNTTGLVPVTDFDGNPIWQDGQEPDANEVSRRQQQFHTPYHAALKAEIARVKAIHGVAVLYDCHSIRSHIPFLFDGKLPDFNIGTDNGTTCEPRIEQAVVGVCGNAAGFTSVLNGRFRGGWTTRHYANPAQNIHTVQMELAQSTHLAREEPPFDYDETVAAPLRAHLKTILQNIEKIAFDLAKGN
ncbi:N-formylglutamate amidohydrolase [Thalassospira profundimaris]|uniref:N-formylglutamate amidohydrolase n=1 Tax=Thalassospira profundimaris TaxID=502049 RepID=A0A367WUZ0_9PROT|nr:N-formylglutamate deformylase [Thalassospira profundimaris]RCK45273.1 N-formylglutamate amidohydrolase [Thalassospira profundimaris]